MHTYAAQCPALSVQQRLPVPAAFPDSLVAADGMLSHVTGSNCLRAGHQALLTSLLTPLSSSKMVCNSRAYHLQSTMNELAGRRWDWQALIECL